MLWYFISSSVMALGGFVIYLYYHHKGQFDDEEDVKYQMFREEE